MSELAGKVCRSPVCGHKIAAGNRYCLACKIERTRQQDANRAGAEHRRIYRTSLWRSLRRVVLASEPRCRACQQAGQHIPATDVDHIQPVQRGGQPYEMENLQPLCKGCHSAKTMREMNGQGQWNQ